MTEKIQTEHGEIEIEAMAGGMFLTKVNGTPVQVGPSKKIAIGIGKAMARHWAERAENPEMFEKIERVKNQKAA